MAVTSPAGSGDRVGILSTTGFARPPTPARPEKATTGVWPAAQPPLASAQELPQAVETSSGTERSAAPVNACSVSAATASSSPAADVDDHLVVDLQDEPAGQAAVVQRLVEPGERHLEQVGGEPLDAGVHGLTLGGLADPVVAVGQLRQRTLAAERGPRVATGPGVGDGLLHVGVDLREAAEVPVHDLVGLVDARRQPAGEPERLHAVDQPVRDHLRPVPLDAGDVVGREAVDAGRDGPVDVRAGRERGDEPGVAGQVGEHAQLDLVVVGDEETAALGRHERPPELLAGLGPRRDVVQVRPLRRQPAGPGDGLAERRVDAAVRRDLGQQALAVRRPELLDLAVAQERVDDRMVVAQRLERRRVGRVPGLRLAAGREAELVVEHRPQLRRRVDVELVAGEVVDLGHQPLRLGHQVVGDPP